MELQHVNIKLFVENDANIDFEQIVKTFHQWTAEQTLDELLIDVADYLHVPSGPGIVLVGHEADYALDNAQDRWGLLYNRKASVDGTNAQRFAQAFSAAAKAAGMLEKTLDGLTFVRNELYLSINDRALAPNTQETFEACQSEISDFATTIFGVSDISTDQESDPRRRFGVHVNSRSPFELSAPVA